MGETGFLDGCCVRGDDEEREEEEEAEQGFGEHCWRALSYMLESLGVEMSARLVGLYEEGKSSDDERETIYEL